MSKRKICIITGTRAEYGLLSRLVKLINDSPDVELQVIATNMHLSPEFGLTYREIEADGIKINKKVECLLSSDTENGLTKTMGLATIGFGDAFEDLHPDIIVVLGDRYESLAAVQSAMIYRIPIAHIHGGEITEALYDDCIRHAISKMSHLHFTTTEKYRCRVIQMGEEPNRVFNVGSLGIENSKMIPLMGKDELEDSLGFELGDKCVMVTYHPVTLENNTADEQSKNLLEALDTLKDYKIIFTMPNSDTNGRIIKYNIEQYVASRKERCTAYISLGVRRYLSALQYVDAVIGNSSSGIIEVPSFHIPTLNIGSRQDGRLAAESVYNCRTTKEAISAGLSYVLSQEFREQAAKAKNPYEKEGTAQAIFDIISTYPLEGIIQKKFYDL